MAYHRKMDATKWPVLKFSSTGGASDGVSRWLCALHAAGLQRCMAEGCITFRWCGEWSVWARSVCFSHVQWFSPWCLLARQCLARAASLPVFPSPSPSLPPPLPPGSELWWHLPRLTLHHRVKCRHRQWGTAEWCLIRPRTSSGHAACL